MKVNVSILSSTIKPQDIVKELDKTNVDAIHIDIMDGKFVENKTWTIGEITKITKYSNLPLDVHLMVNNPTKYIEDYAMLNTNNITFHYEAVENIDKMINEIKDYGLKVGIAINPDTDIKNIFPYLDRIDLVLVMSVYPGKSGQSFIETTPSKIKELKEYITENDLKTLISVDGGINDETGKLCKDSGVDILVSASYIHKDIKNNIDILKNL